MDYRNKYRSLINIGFLPDEARQLAKLSKYALTKPPYMKRLIRSRRMIVINANRYGWTKDEYVRYIRDKYSKIKDGIYKGHPDFVDGTLNLWALVREMEQESKDSGDEYLPMKRRKKERKTKKRISRDKMPTKKDILLKKIAQLQKQANKARRDVDRLAIEGEIYRYEKEIRAVEREESMKQPEITTEDGLVVWKTIKT